MPPTAAMTGTLSCTVAALVAFNPRNAVYQMAYPTPEANAPDDTAYQTPETSSTPQGSMARLNPAAKLTARKKFPAVTRVGSPVPLPRKE